MKISAAALLLLTSCCAWLGFLPAQAAPPQPAAKGASWQVLVLDRVAARTKDAPSKWATVWSDGTRVKRFEAPVVHLSQRLLTLKIPSRSEKGACPQGKYPFSYQVDQLVAEPLGGGEAQVIWGEVALSSARALKNEHMASCDTLKPLPGATDTTESYERSRLDLLSAFCGGIGLETVTESLSYGRPAPMVLADWGSYRLKGDELMRMSKKYLPEGSSAEAAAKFARLPAAEREGFSPPDLGHFILVPSGGGVAVEFGVPGTADGQKGKVKVVRVDRPDGLKDEYAAARKSFVAAHPKLVNWQKASFYSVAPDGQAVVYGLDGKLYWQGVSGKPRQIALVKDVRGWQWLDGQSLDPGERKALGLP